MQEPVNDDQQIYDQVQAARYLGISATTIPDYVRKKDLPDHRYQNGPNDKEIWFTKGELDKYKAKFPDRGKAKKPTRLFPVQEQVLREEPETVESSSQEDALPEVASITFDLPDAEPDPINEAQLLANMIVFALQDIPGARSLPAIQETIPVIRVWNIEVQTSAGQTERYQIIWDQTEFRSMRIG